MYKMKENIFLSRTGTLFNQKHAVRFKTLISFLCLLCHHSDSVLHILSGCQHQIISGMITEIHNIAYRLIMKAIEAGSLGRCFVQVDIGSEDRLAYRDVTIHIPIVWQARYPRRSSDFYRGFTKPMNPCSIYQQNRPRMAHPSPVSFKAKTYHK